MFGQKPNKYRRYRHLDRKRMRRECKRPESCNQIDAEEIEHIVLRYLFEMFGNAAYMRKAIERATPNRQELERNRQRIERIEKDLEKIRKGKAKLVDNIYEGLEDEIDKKLSKLNERKTR